MLFEYAMWIYAQRSVNKNCGARAFNYILLNAEDLIFVGD